MTSAVYMIALLFSQPAPDAARLDPIVTAQIDAAKARLEGIEKPSGRDVGRLGMLYLAYEQYGNAKTCFERAAQLDPTDPQWPYMLGALAQSQHEPAIAIRYFEAALKIRPKSLLFALRIGEASLTLGELDGSEISFMRALELNPADAASLAGLAQILRLKGKITDSIRSYEAALKAQPEATSLYYPLGLAYRAAGEKDRAVDLLTRRGHGQPVVDDPYLAEVHSLRRGKQAIWQRGYDAATRGDWAAAADTFRQLTNFYSDDPAGWLELGAALLRLGRIAEAAASFQSALALDASLALGHLNLGICYTQVGNSEQALEHYKEALQIDAELIAAWFNAGNEATRLGRFEEAATFYAGVQRRQPANPFASVMLGATYARLGRFDQALITLEHAHAMHPQSVEVGLAFCRVLAVSFKDRKNVARSLSLAQEYWTKEPDLESGKTLVMALLANARGRDALQLIDVLIGQVEKAQRSDLRSELDRLKEIAFKGEKLTTPWFPDDSIYKPVPTAPQQQLTHVAPPR